MTKNSRLLQALADSPDWEKLEPFLLAAKLPDMKRGQRVWAEFCGRIVAAEITRRVPGNVYWAKLDEPVEGMKNFVVSVGNFRGRWK
jgi:hypothetical protein